jgi:hypothetical protein
LKAGRVGENAALIRVACSQAMLVLASKSSAVVKGKSDVEQVAVSKAAALKEKQGSNPRRVPNPIELRTKQQTPVQFGFLRS